MCPLPSPKALDAAGNVSTTLLAPAAYKVCYAYAEDAPADGGAPPDARLAVELPLATARLTVRRPSGSAAPRALAHGEALGATVQPGDAAWFGLPLVCGAGAGAPPLQIGCVEGEALAAALELDATFNASLLRYESVHLLLAHAPTLQPDATDAPECFDGLAEAPLLALAAGYFAAGADDGGATGFEQLEGVDRATRGVALNVTGGACAPVPRTKLWVRVRCALGAGVACAFVLRATLLPTAIRPGADTSLLYPLEPGAAGAAARGLLQVQLSDADILRVSVRRDAVGCGGGPPNATAEAEVEVEVEAEAETGAEAEAAERLGEGLGEGLGGAGLGFGFSGQLVVQGEGACPLAFGDADFDRRARPTAAQPNATLEYFCTDRPGLYTFVLDAQPQPAFTEGPGPFVGDGGVAFAGGGGPLGTDAGGGEVCASEWAALGAALGTPPPRTWREGQPNNVLRRGRLRVSLTLYRSDELWYTTPFVSGERRESCLSYAQVSRRVGK